MATKTILRLTNTDAVIKIDGAIGSVTIDLATDLKLATENISGTPTVNIIGMQATGAPTGVVTVARNSANIYILSVDNAPCIDMLEFGNTSDSRNNTSNIVVTTTVAESQLILKVRKQSGYVTRIRTEQTGSETPV